jgi:uncharacterized protein (DUF58 family)
VVQDSPTERRCYFLKVAAGARQVAGYRRTPARRGILRFTGFRLATRYPFGIFEKWRNLHAPGEMLVYPALLDVGSVEPDESAHGTDMSVNRVGPGTEISGLRDYVYGDEARNIHWMRSASLARFVVRERERDASSHLTITLDNARPQAAGDEWEARFETAISRSAFIAVSAVSRGVAVEVVTRGSRSPTVPPGAPPDPILRFLALLDAVPADASIPFAPRTPTSRQLDVHVSATTESQPSTEPGPA